MVLLLSEPLKRFGCKPGHFRVAALGSFMQLLHRSPHVALRRKNRCQVQAWPCEIGAQPERLLILPGCFGQLPLSREKST